MKFNLEIPKFFVIRRFRPNSPKEDGQSKGITVLNRADNHPTLTVDPESIPSIVSPGVQEQSNLSFATSITQSPSNSFGHQVRDGANLALSILSPISGAVPIVGSSIQGAVNGLLEILNAVDQIGRNKDDIRELRSKLYDLNDQISAIPTAGSDFDVSRNRLTLQLNETSNTLKKLCERRNFQYSSVAKAISQCGRDIDRHLVQFSALNTMQLAHYAQRNDKRVDKIDSRTQRIEREIQAMRASIGLMQHMSMGVVFVMDAMGQQHSIPMCMAGSLEQLKDAMRVYFRPETPKGCLLRRWMDDEYYNLDVDDGRQILQITNNDEWSRVEPGTTIIMSTLIAVPQSQNIEYLCPSCEKEMSGYSALDCLGCSRRFHITEGDNTHLTDRNMIVSTI